MKLIVTDLTRFKDNDNVCMALLDAESCTCHRPLPYVTKAIVQQKGIYPGMTVEATVIPNGKAARPHVEDCIFVNDLWLGMMDEILFKDLLERSAVDSVNEAFCGTISSKKRCVPLGSPPDSSIRTIRVDPLSLSLSVVGTVEQKLRLSFKDKSGEIFRHTPIADLNFHSSALKYVQQERVDEFNTALAGGEEVYIRLGLSRVYKGKNGKQGYWMQANGIYCFPGCFCAEM
ncbi:hypothetical protein SAMN05660337_1985 [Maridesulfovibrio ferrireducens]|uniref:Uncharacterized protein n=1 Tax=Maridesulfovibrio ferrireducens TaxID=246191 RepID=A0A1G9H2V1_9BACT|nr:hypothetical protein [Maridesulfovibrio ferrireducens]SDL07278.1 hypothetical protein SAMN05660337_1985 [Maridesulfovibrio ferrireducens]